MNLIWNEICQFCYRIMNMKILCFWTVPSNVLTKTDPEKSTSAPMVVDKYRNVNVEFAGICKEVVALQNVWV